MTIITASTSTTFTESKRNNLHPPDTTKATSSPTETTIIKFPSELRRNSLPWKPTLSAGESQKLCDFDSVHQYRCILLTSALRCCQKD